MGKNIKVTLVRSTNGRNKRQRETVKSLGLGKINSYAVHKPTPDIMGKINAVSHLVQVEEISE